MIFVEGRIISEDVSLGVVEIHTLKNDQLRFYRSDVVGMTPTSNGIEGFILKPDSKLFKSAELSQDELSSYVVSTAEENVIQPSFSLTDADPMEGDSASQLELKTGISLEGACKLFNNSCAGSGEFNNNCAHYLSDALIRTRYTDLNTNISCIEIRCNHDNTCSLGDVLNHRVIRAKNLRCWFAQKAKHSSTTVTRNTGFWATYQERTSDGQGHVAILDSNRWRFYGTGWYSQWKQEYYQWDEIPVAA